MDIIQALKKLRQDIQSWVTLNVRNVLGKISEHTSDTTIHITTEEKEKLDGLTTETWTFTLEDGTTVTKRVVIG